MDLKALVRTIPNFPQPPVQFRDITTLIKNPDGLAESVDQMKKSVEDIDFDIIAGPESRGFIFGVPLAIACHTGFVLLRKPGKLPADTYSVEYSLEYGTAKLEMHKDAILPGQRVLIVDDLLATGGTGKAMVELIEKAGGVVAGFAFVIELPELKGRENLEGYEVRTLISFDGE